MGVVGAVVVVSLVVGVDSVEAAFGSYRFAPHLTSYVPHEAFKASSSSVLVLVVGLEKTGSGQAEVRARRVHADGRPEETWTLAQTQKARGSGFPRLVVTDHGVVAAWTEAGEPSRVRLALL